MDTIKLFDSEIKVMDIVWENEPITAKEISRIAAVNIGWNKNTTYTIIKKLIEKECIERREPNFVCVSKIDKNLIQKNETSNLIEKLYNGSKKAFFAAFLQNEKLSEKDIAELKEMIDKR